MKKNIKTKNKLKNKLKNKQKQKQSVNVKVHIDQSKRTIARKPNSNSGGSGYPSYPSVPVVINPSVPQMSYPNNYGLQDIRDAVKSVLGNAINAQRREPNTSYTVGPEMANPYSYNMTNPLEQTQTSIYNAIHSRPTYTNKYTQEPDSISEISFHDSGNTTNTNEYGNRIYPEFKHSDDLANVQDYVDNLSSISSVTGIHPIFDQTTEPQLTDMITTPYQRKQALLNSTNLIDKINKALKNDSKILHEKLNATQADYENTVMIQDEIQRQINEREQEEEVKQQALLKERKIKQSISYQNRKLLFEDNPNLKHADRKYWKLKQLQEEAEIYGMNINTKPEDRFYRGSKPFKSRQQLIYELNEYDRHKKEYEDFEEPDIIYFDTNERK